MDDGTGEILMAMKSISKGFNLTGTRDTEKGGDTRLEILSDVDFNIYKGDTIAIVGNSGIGKSTLLHIIGTLDKPDKGEILFMGQELFSMEEEKLALFRNTKIGFVFQFHHLLQGFTAAENVMIPCMLNKKKNRKQKNQQRLFCQEWDLEKNYSAG